MVGVPLVSEAAGDDGEVDDDVAEGPLATNEGPPLAPRCRPLDQQDQH